MRAGGSGRKQLSWMRDLAVGDVLREGRRGPLRVVRRIRRYTNGDLGSVTLVIRRCSWTHQCYTVLTYTDLIQRVFVPVRAKRRRLASRLDERIHRSIVADGRGGLTCCDVHGVA